MARKTKGKSKSKPKAAEVMSEEVIEEITAEEAPSEESKEARTEDEVINDVTFEAEGLDIIEDENPEDEDLVEAADVEGSELESFESAEIEEKLFIDDDQMFSIIESILFSTDRPISPEYIKQAFKGTTVNIKKVRKAIEEFGAELAASNRGVYLEQISGGYQLRTKQDNVDFLKALKKERPFKLSGPALEVLAIVSYEQPCIKARVDEIRAVESGHLMRALMDKGIIAFAGKSELPGKPMLYKTTKKFLEIFGLKTLKELPSLDEIDNLIPEGIGEDDDDQTLGELTEGMGIEAGVSYSESEGELMKISDDLANIDTSSDFFEEEKRREKEKRDRDRAEDIRMALEDGEEVEKKDRNWLERYEALQMKAQEEAEAAAAVAQEVAAETDADNGAQVEASNEDAETTNDAELETESSEETDESASAEALSLGSSESDTETSAVTEAVNEALAAFEDVDSSSDEIEIALEEVDNSSDPDVKT